MHSCTERGKFFKSKTNGLSFIFWTNKSVTISVSAGFYSNSAYFHLYSSSKLQKHSQAVSCPERHNLEHGKARYRHDPKDHTCNISWAVQQYSMHTSLQLRSFLPFHQWKSRSPLLSVLCKCFSSKWSCLCSEGVSSDSWSTSSVEKRKLWLLSELYSLWEMQLAWKLHPVYCPTYTVKRFCRKKPSC